MTVIRDKPDHTGPEDFYPFSVTAHLSFPSCDQQIPLRGAKNHFKNPAKRIHGCGFNGGSTEMGVPARGLF